MGRPRALDLVWANVRTWRVLCTVIQEMGRHDSVKLVRRGQTQIAERQPNGASTINVRDCHRAVLNSGLNNNQLPFHHR